LWPNRGRDRRKLRKTSVRIATVFAEIRTQHLQNTRVSGVLNRSNKQEGASFDASAMCYAACQRGGNELDSDLGQTRATAQARKSRQVSTRHCSIRR
jgi:hypothetical protein